MDMHKKYGSIMKEEALFNIPIINVFEKSDIETVMKSSGKYPIRPPTEAVAQYRRSRPERYASVGLVNEQGNPIPSNHTSIPPKNHSYHRYVKWAFTNACPLSFYQLTLATSKKRSFLTMSLNASNKMLWNISMQYQSLNTIHLFGEQRQLLHSKSLTSLKVVLDIWLMTRSDRQPKDTPKY